MKPYKNNQEAFDKAYEWARTHDYCYHREHGCMYFNPDTGNRCLVGGLIPMDLAKSIPNQEVRLAEKNNPEIKELFKNVDIGFLSSMQRVHDHAAANCMAKPEYLRRLRNLAEAHKLS